MAPKTILLFTLHYRTISHNWFMVLSKVTDLNYNWTVAGLPQRSRCGPWSHVLISSYIISAKRKRLVFTPEYLVAVYWQMGLPCRKLAGEITGTKLSSSCHLRKRCGCLHRDWRWFWIFFESQMILEQQFWQSCWRCFDSRVWHHIGSSWVVPNRLCVKSRKRFSIPLALLWSRPLKKAAVNVFICSAGEVTMPHLPMIGGARMMSLKVMGRRLSADEVMNRPGLSSVNR